MRWGLELISVLVHPGRAGLQARVQTPTSEVQAFSPLHSRGLNASQ